MVSKAAERSRTERQESFCEPIALMRWSWMHKRDVSVEWCHRYRQTGEQIVRKEVIWKPRFNNTFDYFRNKRNVRDWTIIRKLLIV